MKIISLLGLALLACANSSRAAQIHDIAFEDKIQLGGKTLVLNGLGLRQATFLKVNVYAGGLYLEQPSHDGEQIAASNTLKRIRMTFMRDVGKGKIADAWMEGFEKNCSAGCDAAKPAVHELQAMTPDVKKGDVMTFDFYADHVDVDLNGAKKTLQGKEIAHALIRLWIGKNPPNSELKEGLLGAKG